MSSSSEMPRLPAEDRLETQQLTVASLAADCAEFADLDEEFLNRDRIISSVHSGWEKSSGTSWRVGFTAMHCYEDRRYVGQSYALQLMVAQKTTHISNELKLWAKESNIDIPNEENILSIVVSHAATFIISQYVTLGWNSHREYEIEHNQSSLYELDEDTEEAAEAVQSTVYTRTVSRSLEYYDAPEVSHERELGDSYSDDIEGELMDCLDTEMHLRQAKDVLAIMQANSEGDFDLSTVIPLDILEALNRSQS